MHSTTAHELKPRRATLTVIGHTPTIYLLKGCPFCLKLIFLLEVGLIDRVKLVEATIPEE